MTMNQLADSISCKQTRVEPKLRFFIYQPEHDYYLGPLHACWRVPTHALTVSDADSADFFLLPEDLRHLQIDLGTDAIRKIAETLPYYNQCPEKHVFWSSHDDPGSPLPDSVFCKTSVSQQEPGSFVAVPYQVDDCLRWLHFDQSRIVWQTCFVGYPGSSPVREQLLLAIAASRQINSRLDIAPKFHSHLEQAIRDARRITYLETLAASLTALCPRGDGMNSIRFFETLSMGRIPVLIADNCVLPFESVIPYHRFVIRIAELDISHADNIIAAWIRDKSCDELLNRCREARQVWEEWLTPEMIADPLQQELKKMLYTAAPKGEELPNCQTTMGAHNGFVRSCHQQAHVCYAAGNYAAAEFLFKKALAVCPDDPETIRCLALLLNENGRSNECISLLTSLQNPPSVSALHRLLGEAYQQTNQWDLAYQQLCQDLLDETDKVTTLINLGIVCSKRNHQHEALDFLQRAVTLAPDSALVWMNLGCVLQQLNRIHEATAALYEAVRLEPTNGTAAWNLAQILLLQGNFKEGLPLFESRFNKRDPVPRLTATAPFWQGEPLAGKTIIVTTEQAFGDAIQFVRYLPLLAQQGAVVVLYNHLKPLQQLFCSVPGVRSVIADPAHLPPADYQLPMLSLPSLFCTTLATIPNRQIPYLEPPREKLSAWSKKMIATDGVRIGLCWAGRAEPDPLRSAALSVFAPLTQLSGAVFYSLQLGEGAVQAVTPPPGMRLIDLTGELVDFEDTAALIAQLDLVISVDTSVAHLAGALGKPVFILLPYMPDWRWMLERQDTPWYPTMRLFRQKTAGDWKHVVNSVLIMITQALPDADGSPSNRHTV